MKASTKTAVEPSIVADGLVNVSQAAQFLALSRSKVYRLMDAGQLRFVKIGTARRIPRSSLIELAEANLVAAGT